jgi:hypothetical protein
MVSPILENMMRYSAAYNVEKERKEIKKMKNDRSKGERGLGEVVSSCGIQMTDLLKGLLQPGNLSSVFPKSVVDARNFADVSLQRYRYR